jgi:hypothetical protein
MGKPIPYFAGLSTWCELSGLPATTTYSLIESGRLHAARVEGKLIVDVKHGLRYLRSLPEARLTPPLRRARANSATTLAKYGARTHGTAAHAREAPA